MSVLSVCTAEGGMVLLYLMDEAAGATTFADSSGNTLPATIGSRGAAGGTAVVTGMANAGTATGSAGTGSFATRAVAGGSPIQLTTGITVFGFVRPSSYTPVGTRGLLGERANNWLARWDTSRRLQVFLYLAGVLQNVVTGVSGLTNGERGLYWFTYDGVFATVGVNDGIEAKAFMPGTITATTDTLSIATASNNAFDGQVGPWGMMNHACDLGFFRALVREDSTMDYGAVSNRGSVLFDYSGDLNAAVSSSTEGESCRYCGARMRTTENRVITSAGRYYHPSCRRFKLVGQPADITSGSSQADVLRRVEGFTRDLLNMASHTPRAGKSAYWDGTTGRWIHGTNPTGANFWNESGFGLAAAAAARHLRVGRRDPLIQVARKHVELNRANHGTTSWWSNADFSLPMEGKTIVMLNGLMDPVEWQEWATDFVTWTETYIITAPGHGKQGPFGPWYINGNRDWGNVEALWCAWYLDPTSTRLANFNSYVDWVVTPNPGSYQPGGASSGELFGLRTTVTPVEADGSDGQGYFAESHGGSKGFWNIGGVADNDGDRETLDVDGLDYVYLMTQTERLASLYLLTGEQRFARWANMCRNKIVADRLNTSTGVIEASFGSRHCGDYSWQNAIDLAFTWKGQRAVPIDGTFMANMFKITERQAWAHGRAPLDSTGRDFGNNIPQFFWASTAWPGH